VALLEHERDFFNDDIDKERSRRESASALSKQYQAEIARRTEARRPQMKLGAAKEEAADVKEFFPFTHGEQLEKRRRDLARQQHKELCDHLALVNPSPRVDPLKPRPVRKYGAQTNDPQKPAEAHSFNNEYPCFLKKAKEYATRLPDPKVGHLAMKQRVAEAYEALQRDYAARLAERESIGLGKELTLADGLEAEAQKASVEERRKNAAAIREQMEEQRRRRAEEKQQARAEHHGYYGPKDKRFTVQQSLAKEHADDLRRQIEVDKERAKDLRDYELAQDRLYHESHVNDMLNDQRRAGMREKKSQRMLKESWDQQVKMRQVRSIIQHV
jgi:hypothetical protein